MPASNCKGQAQSVALSRTRHRIRQFRDVLVRIAQHSPLFGEARKRRGNNLVLWIQTASHAQENIRIHQARSNDHLIWS